MPRKSSKCNFKSWSWEEGKNIPLKVFAPASRQLSPEELERRRLIAEMKLPWVPEGDPNLDPEVRKRIESVPFRSPLKNGDLCQPEYGSKYKPSNS